MSRRGFVERAIGQLLRLESHAMVAEAGAARRGVLQRLDPRVKVAGAGILLVAAAASRNIVAIAAMLAAVTLLALASRLSAGAMAARVWLPVLLFVGVMAAPALVTTPGATRYVLPWGLVVTEQGMRAALMLLTRVETAATLSYVLVMTTTWPRVLAALRRLRVPAPIVVLLSMTTRYVFLLVRTAHDMLLSRRSRAVGVLKRRDERQLAAAMMGTLLLRSLSLSRDVHDAMRARGFRGSVETLDEFEARPVDAVALLAAVTVATLAVWSGL